MINLCECKKILNAGERKYTDVEVSQIREYVYFLAKIQLEIEESRTKDNDNETIQ